MKTMAKLNLLSIGIVLGMTFSVLGVGTLIINDILYKSEERVLRLELSNASRTILQRLNSSGARAAAETAAELQHLLQQKKGLKTVQLSVVEAPDNRVVYHADLAAGERASFDFVDQMFRREDGTIEYEFKQDARYAVFTKAAPVNWVFGLSISKQEMLEQRADFLLAIGAITFVILALNALLIRAFGQRLLQRIGAAQDCVKRIEQGELSARIPVDAATDEIGQLQRGINLMSARIQQRTIEQQQAEQALRDSRLLLRSILDNSTAAIFVKDLEGRYLMINRYFGEVCHVEPETIAGRTDYDIFSRERADVFRAIDLQVLESCAAVQNEEIAPHADGPHNYLTLKYPLLDAAGQPYAVCGISTDITERKQAEAERQARYAAEAANRAKSDFLSVMSHELRTPLNAVLGYTQILKREQGLGEKQTHGLNIIEQSGRHLLTLINDLLDLAKIEAGKFELFPEPTRLPALLNGVNDIIRIRAEEKSLQFSCELPPDLPGGVLIDEKRLRQVLLNLLSNAVKFTEHGQVCLRVQTLATADTQARLRFEVSDTGVGIQRAQLDAIFQAFEQVGNARYRAGGTGLGLFISRQLVRQMGSEIHVESAPGSGSRFWFELALAVSEAPAASRPPQTLVTGYQGARRKILIADDVIGNRALLADMLGELGFELCEACDGRETVEQVALAKPDLVLMDLVMPEMDGIEAIRRIRALPAQIAIIAISAGADHDDQLRSMASGANAFLLKPIEHGGLLAAIGACLDLRWTEAQSAPPPERHVATAALVIPPQQELEVLHQHARTGNMRAIRQQAARLAELDERFRPFSDKLDRLAQDFQSKAILSLVQQHLNPQEAS